MTAIVYRKFSYRFSFIFRVWRIAVGKSMKMNAISEHDTTITTKCTIICKRWPQITPALDIGMKFQKGELMLASTNCDEVFPGFKFSVYKTITILWLSIQFRDVILQWATNYCHRGRTWERWNDQRKGVE